MRDRTSFGRMKSTLISYGKFPFKLLGVALLLRSADLILVQSTYVPDEYYQSLEVAHNKVFGYGLLTWEWSKAVRSSLYVWAVSGIFWILKTLGLDSPEAVVLAPKVFQAALSAFADVYFVRWVHEKRSGQYSWAFIAWITSYFLSYCSTRTLANTFEMNLTTVALYYYPWTPKTDSKNFAAVIALLAFFRPTSCVVWAPLVLMNFWYSLQPFRLLKSYVPVGLGVGALCVALDSYFYGRIVVTPWEFFVHNIIENIGGFYGSHDFLWFFYAGVPAVLGVQFFPFAVGVFDVLSKFKKLKRKLKYDVEAQMVVTVLWTLLVFSLVPHKEFRFLLPLMPMMLYVSSSVCSRWSVNARLVSIYVVGFLFIVLNFCAVLFLGQFHQVGGLAAMSHLRSEISEEPQSRILFLTPCHSLPLYSHLHANVSTRFLTCEPDFKSSPNYIDEAEAFFNDTQGWLRREYPLTKDNICRFPTHIVAYDSLNITNFLYARKYNLTKSFFNSYIYPERTGQHVNIYKNKQDKSCT